MSILESEPDKTTAIAPSLLEATTIACPQHMQNSDLAVVS